MAMRAARFTEEKMKTAPRTDNTSARKEMEDRNTSVHSASRSSGATAPIGKDLLTNAGKAGIPTTISQVDMSGLSDQQRKTLITEIRREYQRQYYQRHKEKAKEYQRQYNLTHKKKARGRGKASFDCPREEVRSTFNTADLMHSPVEKTIKMLEKIINGERMFTM